jgi:UDP-glucose 4-epimerase
MRIAVTGGRGFIGARTVALAREVGHAVWSFDRRDGNDILTSTDALDGAEAVIHLAGLLGTAELFDDPHAAVDVNVHGTLNVLQWCAAHDARYVGISMLDVFPSVYTATKVCASRLATAWHHAYGVPVSHVRAFNAFGPGQPSGVGHPQKIMPTFATRGWRGEPLPVWGDGRQGVDLVHVDDIARMLIDALEHGDDVTFDAGTGTRVSVNEFARLVLEVTGSTGGIDYLPMRTGEVPCDVVASGDGWDRLSWKPTHDLDRVAEVIRSYRDAAEEVAA